MTLDSTFSIGNGDWGYQGVGGPKLALAIPFQLEGCAGSQQGEPRLMESVQGVPWI